MVKYLWDVFYDTDISSSNSLLRYKGRQKYGTACGAVISILAMLAIFIFAIYKLVYVFKRTEIKWGLASFNSGYPTAYNVSTYSDAHFMFAINVVGLDLNTGNRYFDITLSNDKGNRDMLQVTPISYKL